MRGYENNCLLRIVVQVSHSHINMIIFNSAMPKCSLKNLVL